MGYERDDQPGTAFCFAQGDQQVVCGDDSAGTEGGLVTSGPGVTVPNVPNPGSDGGTFEITIVQSWSQETNYARVTQVQVPPTTAGQKVPMVIDLHGNGGQGNLRRLSYLADQQGGGGAPGRRRQQRQPDRDQ